MEAKTTEWRPGPTVCRCCLTEGCYKDISTEYFWMGKREVYSEMLSETLDLNIAYSQSGGPNSNSRLICEPCISRLRDATDFKRQVLECERSFMQYLDPVGSGDIGVSLELDKDVKIERVKDEKTLLDDDDDEFVPPEFGDDDDDDLDDQPLTKLASKIPKKESVDVLDLLDNAKITEKRKSSSKSKSSPAKKKLKKEVASSSKVKPEPRKKKEIAKEIGHNYRTLPAFEKGLFEYVYMKHYSTQRNQLLRCRWIEYKKHIEERIFAPFQFPCTRDLHFYNGCIRFLPSETIHRFPSHRKKLKPGPGVDFRGQMPIPQELMMKRGKIKKEDIGTAKGNKIKQPETK